MGVDHTYLPLYEASGVHLEGIEPPSSLRQREILTVETKVHVELDGNAPSFSGCRADVIPSILKPQLLIYYNTVLSICQVPFCFIE